MGHSSFGPMWPTRNSNIVTLVRRDGLRLPIHKELASLVAMLMDLTEAGHHYDIRPDWTWGYANRPISGTRTPSNHSQGTAVDINAPVNPYASADWHRRNARGTRPFGLAIVTDIPQAVVEMWEAHGFHWGGRYRSKPDPMHFEFMGTVADARRHTANLYRVLSDALTKPPAPKPKPKPAPAPSEPASKTRTRQLQKILRVNADGIFGPVTDAAINRNLIGWRKNLAGNRNTALVKFLQSQGARRGSYPGRIDGIVGPGTNHIIVVDLGQRDGICGPKGWRKAVS